MSDGEKVPESPLSLQHDVARRIERSLNIIAEYKEGVVVENIADRYGVSRNTVLRLARMAGLPKRPKRKISDEHKATALRMLAQGELYSVIAKHVGASESWVHYLAMDHNLQRYRYKRRRKPWL